MRTGVLAAVFAAGVWCGVRMPADRGARPPAGPVRGEDPAVVGVAFGRECERRLVEAIDAAEREIRVAIYSFTRRNISGALARAADRGVSVVVRYDADSSDDRSEMPDVIAFLRRRHVRCEAVQMDGPRAKMHHKFTVVDRRIVLTGSYNYTTSATEANRENLVRIESYRVAGDYLAEFERLR
jgi:phosphatidylserine/phosphatidylglycerophosphate/cardiolipin synthase-like enzyme